ncbi:vitamin-K epoxide reductase [Megachile rotundata]|uniref:vitamin-K epoxide reductase n=1 Tax=Megachile rotundata TaxID=143995 RepID=UPI000258D520|nr:PREDICTED: vitamin K epoxide reductase complex subunit 1-like protein 1 [Megachile rotundata]
MSSNKKSARKINTAIILTCILGFSVSYYAYIVETKVENDDSYEAMCDISEHVSCTKAFASEYGKGFGIIPETSIFHIANSLYGLIFYALVAILSLSNKYIASAFVLMLAIASNIATIYLAYILYKLNNICVVCVSTYIINVILLILAVKKHRKLFRHGTAKRKSK